MLSEAERCWAAAQDAKSTYSKHLAAGQAAAQDRRRIINKLNRACQHSEALVQAVRKCSLHPLQEAEAVAYHLYFMSNYYFEKGSWYNAIASLEATQAVLEPLAAKTGSQTCEATAYEMLDEVQPILRVANAKADSSSDTSAELKFLQDTVQPLLSRLRSTESQASRVKHLTSVKWWDGAAIPLKNADLARAVSSALQIADREVLTASGSLRRFDKSFNALSEAADTAQRIVDENQVCRLASVCVHADMDALIDCSTASSFDTLRGGIQTTDSSA